MKLKLLPLCLATLALASCGGSSSPASGLSISGSATSESSRPVVWQYLDFLQTGKVRIDIINVDSELQLSYGNAALSSNTNLLDLNANSKLSANKNLAADKVFNLIVVVEKQNGEQSVARCDVNLGIEGDKIVEFFSEVAANDLVDCDRAYVAASMGPGAQWTHGLNSKLDDYLNSRTASGK